MMIEATGKKECLADRDRKSGGTEAAVKMIEISLSLADLILEIMESIALAIAMKPEDQMIEETETQINLVTGMMKASILLVRLEIEIIVLKDQIAEIEVVAEETNLHLGEIVTMTETEEVTNQVVVTNQARRKSTD
jgi:2-hydroxy-3-keto-5-methylthiopentenyl-1-phosphate phosphatase